MEIKIHETETERIIIPINELLSTNIKAFEENINTLIYQDNKDITIDLEHVTKIDSMTIAAFIRVKKKLSENGRGFKIINPNEAVFRVLELAGLDSYLLD